MLNFVKKLFGTKYDRDVKKYDPIVAEIEEIFEGLKGLSNDELRQKTRAFQKQIAEELSGIDSQIEQIHEEVRQLEGSRHTVEAEHVEDTDQQGGDGSEEYVPAEEDAEQEDNRHYLEELFKEEDELRKERDKELEKVLKKILPEAFAVVQETARRFKDNKVITVTATDHDCDLAADPNKNYLSIEGGKALWKNQWVAAGGEITWNMVHYPVQLIGGMVLHDGKIAEMATGEGKTLVATLPAYLNGLSGQGVHVITVNDYLARRDAEWIGPIMEFLFLTIDCIDKYKPHSEGRVRAYNCNITYGTNNEFGFDYLRDNMVRSKEEMVQGKHHFAMIDEVDSVLIDDARTPLIISGPVPQGEEEQEYISLKPHVKKLLDVQRKLATNYLAESKKLFREGITGHQEGESGLALLRAYRALPKYRPLIKFLSEEGVKVTLQKAENFYMQEQSKNMHIVDEPLYFTIDEKNRNVELTELGTEYLARGNDDPNFFIMPDIASEMVEIDNDESLNSQEKEQAKLRLSQDFTIKSRRLHSMSQLLKAYTLFSLDEEYVVIDGQVKIVDEQTGRMMEGRRYSDGLHQALEAKENVKLGDITQTYATVTLQNYFRMYHKLSGMTGTAETEASELWDIYKLDVVVIPTNRPIVRDDREDLVFKTAKDKFKAVIEEVTELSQAGRPVLVGTTSVDVSERLSRMLEMRKIDHNVLNAKQHEREATIVAEAGKGGKVTIATNMAGRGTDIKINDEVKAAGGLAIIGTERHDSRRVDRQLRGRAGRQGDPGSSQFYISLEDNLMRLFQSEKIARLMDRMGYEEGEVIQHSMVTKSIERAQKKVEENNFGIRKRLLEYDDVMNIQREAIYKKRANALSGERLSVDLNTMFESFIENLVYDHWEKGDFKSFQSASFELLGYSPKMDVNSSEEENARAFKDNRADDVIAHFQKEFSDYYDRKVESVASYLYPQIRHIRETEGQRYKRIRIPFTDRRHKDLLITSNIEEVASQLQDEGSKTIIRDIEKSVTLAIIDEKWKEHLRSMDELKDSVQAASFEQKDPLVVYKMEAYNLFEQLIYDINEDVTTLLLKGTLIFDDGRSLEQVREQQTDMSKTQTNRTGQDEAARAAAEGVSRRRSKPQTIRRTEEKDAKMRNKPCPCGSGKKFKHCHGRK